MVAPVIQTLKPLNFCDSQIQTRKMVLTGEDLQVCQIRFGSTSSGFYLMKLCPSGGHSHRASDRRSENLAIIGGLQRFRGERHTLLSSATISPPDLQFEHFTASKDENNNTKRSESIETLTKLAAAVSQRGQ
ncbi:hypothetical protein G7Y89_g280 [Cudoniella acicularis]|uniref:Uncharacterized protein n=1 Tax=Cudoniella acicularis TaxID=354080 RepID=A0A8H4W828_9HELO|nr:hypothetical protein G7Y89_g280 [Cudoniella acicularis]